jgi:hypothetical protein
VVGLNPEQCKQPRRPRADALTPEERRDYLSDLLDAVTGLGAARDVLAWVRIRLAREAKQRG